MCRSNRHFFYSSRVASRGAQFPKETFFLLHAAVPACACFPIMINLRRLFLWLAEEVSTRAVVLIMVGRLPLCSTPCFNPSVQPFSKDSEQRSLCGKCKGRVKGPIASIFILRAFGPTAFSSSCTSRLLFIIQKYSTSIVC